MIARPTHKELAAKLREAQALLASSGYNPVDPEKLAEDFDSLGLYSGKEQLQGLAQAFAEASPAHYRGIRPPPRAFERVVVDEEMFEFKWTSLFFRRKMYLKFCLPRSNNRIDLFVFSLHEDRPAIKRSR